MMMSTKLEGFVLSDGIKFASKEEAEDFIRTLRSLKYNNIAGLDECGRGPLAGPVVVACVLLPENHGISGIKDSKKLSKKNRERLASEIVEKALMQSNGILCKVAK